MLNVIVVKRTKLEEKWNSIILRQAYLYIEEPLETFIMPSVSFSVDTKIRFCQASAIN